MTVPKSHGRAMSNDDLVTLATYPDEGTAAIARSVLSAAGIPACAVDGATTTTLWHVGTALGGVRLQVPSSHADEAKRALTESRSNIDETLPQQAWNCPQCEVEVDAGFGICWSCGAPAPESAVSASPHAEMAPPPSSPIDVPPAELSYADELTHGSHSESWGDGDVLADRAWKAAVIGIVLPILLPYVAFLVLRLTTYDLSPRANRKFLGSLFVVFAWFCALWTMFSPFS